MKTRHQSKIFALSMLFFFITGTVGINVSRILCLCCNEFTTEIHLTSLEPQDHCVHGCGCCESCLTHKNHCENSPQEHHFYKITDDWTLSEDGDDLSPEEMILPVNVFYVPVEIVSKSNYISTLVQYRDISPPPEWLCTFLC